MATTKNRPMTLVNKGSTSTPVYGLQELTDKQLELLSYLIRARYAQKLSINHNEFVKGQLIVSPDEPSATSWRSCGSANDSRRAAQLNGTVQNTTEGFGVPGDLGMMERLGMRWVSYWHQNLIAEFRHSLISISSTGGFGDGFVKRDDLNNLDALVVSTGLGDWISTNPDSTTDPEKLSPIEFRYWQYWDYNPSDFSASPSTYGYSYQVPGESQPTTWELMPPSNVADSLGYMYYDGDGLKAAGRDSNLVYNAVVKDAVSKMKSLTTGDGVGTYFIRESTETPTGGTYEDQGMIYYDTRSTLQPDYSTTANVIKYYKLFLKMEPATFSYGTAAHNFDDLAVLQLPTYDNQGTIVAPGGPRVLLRGGTSNPTNTAGAFTAYANILNMIDYVILPAMYISEELPKYNVTTVAPTVSNQRGKLYDTWIKGTEALIFGPSTSNKFGTNPWVEGATTSLNADFNITYGFYARLDVPTGSATAQKVYYFGIS
jgi:hypothetical protein